MANVFDKYLEEKPISQDNLFERYLPVEEKKTIPPTEVKKEERVFELITAPEKEPFKDTFLKKLGRIVVPKSLETRLGLRESTMAEDMMTQEDARLSYFRQKDFEKRYQKEIKEDPQIPKEYKEPESVVGQIAEGIKYVYRSSVIPAIGYMAEATGQQVG